MECPEPTIHTFTSNHWLRPRSYDWTYHTAKVTGHISFIEQGHESENMGLLHLVSSAGVVLSYLTWHETRTPEGFYQLGHDSPFSQLKKHHMGYNRFT